MAGGSRHRDQQDGKPFRQPDYFSTLLKHAASLEWIERNPVVDIEKLKVGEYEAWPFTKLTAVIRYCDEHDQKAARTAFELGIGTGQRIGDRCKMQWAEFDGEYLRVV